MKKLLALTAAGAAAMALAAPATAAIKTVKVGDDWFVRSGAGNPLVTILKGSTVKWTWVGKVAHNVYSLNGPTHFHSPTKVKGTYSRTFKKRGTYTLVCTVHPGMDMKLRIK